jgi:hypothetical protein
MRRFYDVDVTVVILAVSDRTRAVLYSCRARGRTKGTDSNDDHLNLTVIITEN